MEICKNHLDLRYELIIKVDLIINLLISIIDIEDPSNDNPVNGNLVADNPANI